jgi:LysM repeat protein
MSHTLAENMRRFGTKNLQSSTEQSLILKYINTIDSSLKIQEAAISGQLNLYASIQDKIEFLEFVEQNYMNEFFKTNQSVLREFKQNYAVNILNESAISLTERIAKYFNFVRNSILFENNLFEFDAYTDRLTEQGVFDRIKSAGAAALNTVKTGVKKIGRAATNVVKKGAQVVKGVWNKVMQSDVAWFIPGLNIAKVGYKVQKFWDKIKKMTLAQWVEEFRNFLNGVAGIAIQIVLALTGAGNLINMIAWGLLLTYDVVSAIKAGTLAPYLYNILTSAIGLIGSGAAAAVLKPAKNIIASVKEANALIPALTKSPTVWKSVGGLITKVANGGSIIVGKLANVFKWLFSKIPGLKKVLQPISNKLGSVKQMFDKFLYGIKTYAKGGAKQNLGKGHSYLGSADDLAKGLGKKAASTTDKIATKKIAGAAVKAYHTVKAAGETLMKIASRNKTPLDQIVQMNPTLAGKEKIALPVNTKVRVT